jgi:hypothetical protein
MTCVSSAKNGSSIALSFSGRLIVRTTTPGAGSERTSR